MGHPLQSDLTGLNDDQLYTKMSELQKRMTQAYRLGYTDAVYQLQMIIDDYQTEINTRNAKTMQELESKSKQFKSVIDIS